MRRAILPLLLFLATPAWAADRTVVDLSVQEPDHEGTDARGPLLIRELMRQAVLIAARDELGLRTRDEALREPIPEEEQIDVLMALTTDESAVFKLRRGSKVFSRVQLDMKGHEASYDVLVSKFEKLSRHELVDALRSAGFTGKPLARDMKRGPLPDGIKARLERFTVWEQFAAARELHGLMSRSGETPERLGALARAYANLGLLVEGHWSVAHKVFKARALLYAERLRVLDDEDADDDWVRSVRGYVRGLAGLHAFALSDLDAVSSAPSSARAVAAWIQGDRAWLETDERARAHPVFSKLLAFVALEDTRALELERAKALELLAAEPECYRVLDVLATIAPVGSRDAWTARGPELLESTLATRLEGLSGLADEAKARGKKGVARAVAALVAAADEDREEPSWAVLGHVLEDTAILQAFRRVEYLNEDRKGEVAGYVEEQKTLLRHHPYGKLIRSYAFERSSTERKELLDDIEIVDASYDHAPLIHATWGAAGETRGQGAWNGAYFHLDSIERDARQIVISSNQGGASFEHLRRNATWLQGVSRHSGIAVATRFRVEWDQIAAYAANQEARTQSPDVLEALAEHWDQARKPRSALRCWKKRVALSPDAFAILHLAEAEERAGEIGDWLKTLDAYFEKTPGGRDHAALRTKVARRLLEDGRAAEAIPYVLAAAEREEEAALLCAAECFERTGDMASAERWVKRLSECYAAHGADWFTWCKRTGAGDVAAAQAWGESFAKSWSESNDPGTVAYAARFYLLACDTKKAVRAARVVAEGKHDPFFGLLVAILSKVADRRETVLEDVVENGAGAPSLVLLGRVFTPCLEHAERLDESAVEAVRAQAEPRERARLDYLVGLFLESRSRPDAARGYFERCLAEEEASSELPDHALARDGLKRLASR
jgi:hypothetical protein